VHEPLSDAGLKEVARLKNLAYLNLVGTCVTDAGLQLCNDSGAGAR
jgi:hypothetical protein